MSLINISYPGQVDGVGLKYYLMPIYEFVCKTCCRHFEALVRMGGEKDVVCPECGRGEIQKLFSTFGIGGGSSRTAGSGASAGAPSSAGSSACASCASRSCSTCR